MFRLAPTRLFRGAVAEYPPGEARPRPASGKHLPQLDALRGIACLMVLVAHLKAVPLLGWVPERTGQAAVGVFFVLSGFLITRILLADRSLAGFFNRRVARIFPVYYLTLLAVAIVWPGREVGWAATFTFNFRFLAESNNYFAAAATGPPLAHFWSLCVEEHFYWLWPVAVWALPRRALRYGLGAILVATPVVTHHLAERLLAVGFSPAEVDGLLSRNSLTQLVALACGGLVALHEPWLSRPGRAVKVGGGLFVAAAAGRLLAVGLGAEAERATDATTMHLMAGGVFLVAFGSPALGRAGVLAAAGVVSYGLYLFHLPVYAALGLTDLTTAATPATAAAALVVTVALAVLSYRLVERPILTWVRAGRPASRVGVVLSFAAAVGFAVSLTAAALSLAERAAAIPAPPSPAAEDDGEGPAEPRTGFGSTVTTLVLGSSHAEYGIATLEFRGVAYNLASGGQDLWYDCHIARYQLSRRPTVRRVVFSIDGHAVHATVSRTERHQWRQSLYFHVYGIRARVDDPRLYDPLPLAASEFSRWQLDHLKQKRDLVDEPLRGWFPAKKDVFDPAHGKRRAAEVEAFPSELDDNVALLIRTLGYCRRKGVACVLVTVPTHDTYRDNLSSGYRAESQAATRRIVEATGVPHLDYESDPRFREGDFFDCDHLNTTGAVKFARLLDADLTAACPVGGK